MKNSIGDIVENAYNTMKQNQQVQQEYQQLKKGNFMKLIENIKSGIEEYKHYKHPRHSNALMQNSKSRNIFNYIQSKKGQGESMAMFCINILK